MDNQRWKRDFVMCFDKLTNRYLPSAFAAIFVMQVLLLVPNSTKADSELYFVHNDHLGTPQVVTDENQTVVWRGRQKPFGETTESTNTVEQSARFSGQYFDEETGLHYNWHRYYDPSTGRYTQSDRLGLFDGPNTYTYVYNNPLTYTDPTGEFGVPGAIIGAIAGGYGAYLQGGECTSLSDVLIGAGVGAITGLVGGGIVTAIGSIGGGTAAGLGAIAGATSGVAGSYAGQITTGGVGNINHLAAAGAGIGGAFGGAYGALGAGVAGDMFGAQLTLTGEVLGSKVGSTLDENLGLSNGSDNSDCGCNK